jgi:hypothetical protein
MNWVVGPLIRSIGLIEPKAEVPIALLNDRSLPV